MQDAPCIEQSFVEARNDVHVVGGLVGHHYATSSQYGDSLRARTPMPARRVVAELQTSQRVRQSSVPVHMLGRHQPLETAKESTQISENNSSTFAAEHGDSLRARTPTHRSRQSSVSSSRNPSGIQKYVGLVSSGGKSNFSPVSDSGFSQQSHRKLSTSNVRPSHSEMLSESSRTVPPLESVSSNTYERSSSSSKPPDIEDMSDDPVGPFVHTEHVGDSATSSKFPFPSGNVQSSHQRKSSADPGSQDDMQMGMSDDHVGASSKGAGDGARHGAQYTDMNCTDESPLSTQHGDVEGSSVSSDVSSPSGNVQSSRKHRLSVASNSRDDVQMSGGRDDTDISDETLRREKRPGELCEDDAKASVAAASSKSDRTSECGVSEVSPQRYALVCICPRCFACLQNSLGLRYGIFCAFLRCF